jgi:hypothetical protein
MAEFIPNIDPNLVRQQIVSVFADRFQLKMLAIVQSI